MNFFKDEDNNGFEAEVDNDSLDGDEHDDSLNGDGHDNTDSLNGDGHLDRKDSLEEVVQEHIHNVSLSSIG